MNFPTNKPSHRGVGNAGAVGFGEPGAASAQLSVGAVGFGPTWQDDEPTLRQMYESACASIVRLECEADELRAEVALLQAQARVLTDERDEARLQYRSTEALGMALVKTIGELKAERVELKMRLQEGK